MDAAGIAFCVRFACPPNSLSLCGPEEHGNVLYYASQCAIDPGAKELLTKFQTLYPYLRFIAGENHIKDPFDKKVVEAYWIGNNLLLNTNLTDFIKFLEDEILLKKKLNPLHWNNVLSKISSFTLPHHSYHVINLFAQTEDHHSTKTLKTMDACIINWGLVESVQKTSVIIRTRPLCRKNNVIFFGSPVKRIIKSQGYRDRLLHGINNGDYISYHWGRFTSKLTPAQVNKLSYFNRLALCATNYSQKKYEKKYILFG